MFSAADAPSTDIPPLRLSWLAPGARVTTDWKSRPFGRRSIAAAARLVAAVVCFTSIVVASATTFTVSLTPADHELEVDLQQHADGQGDGWILGRREAVHGRDDLVDARFERRETVDAATVCHCRQRPTRALRLDRRTWKHAAHRVLDDAFDRSACLLGRRPARARTTAARRRPRVTLRIHCSSEEEPHTRGPTRSPSREETPPACRSCHGRVRSAVEALCSPAGWPGPFLATSACQRGRIEGGTRTRLRRGIAPGGARGGVNSRCPRRNRAGIGTLPVPAAVIAGAAAVARLGRAPVRWGESSARSTVVEVAGALTAGPAASGRPAWRRCPA